MMKFIVEVIWMVIRMMERVFMDEWWSVENFPSVIMLMHMFVYVFMVMEVITYIVSTIMNIIVTVIAIPPPVAS